MFVMTEMGADNYGIRTEMVAAAAIDGNVFLRRLTRKQTSAKNLMKLHRRE